MENIKAETQLLERKKHIRRAAVIFICIIILLTFFSNTINNYLLPVVECDTASSGMLTNNITAEGEVFPVSTETIYAYGNWRVKAVKAVEGQEVAAGEELAVIDSKDLQLDIKRAELNVLKLESDLRKYENGFQEIDIQQYKGDCEAALKTVQKAQKSLDAQKELYAVNAVSLESVNDAQDKLEDAKSGYTQKLKALRQKEAESKKSGENYGIDLSQKKAELEIGRLELQKLKTSVPGDGIIKAPVSGTVKSISAQNGSVTSSGQSLFEIVKKASGLAVKWKLDTKPAGEVNVKDSVEISGAADESFEFNGEVKEKKYLADEGKYQFVTHTDAPKGKLQVGQRVEVAVRKESKQYDTLVPNSSIVDEGGRKNIFILKDRQGVLGTETYVRKVEISIIEEDDFNSAVSLAGFTGDEKIVIFSSKALSDGLQVKLR